MLVLRSIANARPGGDGWLRGNCPWCEQRVGKEDRKKCLGLQLHSGKWHCFRCSASGYIARLPDDLRDFAKDAPAAKLAAKAMDPPEGFYLLFDGPGMRAQSLAAPRHYLHSTAGTEEQTQERAWAPSIDVLREAQVGACVSGTYEGRVVVPVLGTEVDEEGELPWLGWSSRPWVPDPKGLGYRLPRRNDALSTPLQSTRPCFVNRRSPRSWSKGCVRRTRVVARRSRYARRYKESAFLRFLQRGDLLCCCPMATRGKTAGSTQCD